MCTERDIHLKTACCTLRSGEGHAGGVPGTKWELLVAVSWLGLSCSWGHVLPNTGSKARLDMQHRAGGAAVVVTAPWCIVVFWSGSPLHIRGYRKGKDLLTFCKVCELLSIATSASIISITCACLYSCFKCFENTLLFLLQWRKFCCLAPGVRIRPYQKSLWRCSRAIKNCEAKSWWLFKISLLPWKVLDSAEWD